MAFRVRLSTWVDAPAIPLLRPAAPPIGAKAAAVGAGSYLAIAAGRGAPLYRPSRGSLTTNRC